MRKRGKKAGKMKTGNLDSKSTDLGPNRAMTRALLAIIVGGLTVVVVAVGILLAAFILL
jgi:hypothetical protein